MVNNHLNLMIDTNVTIYAKKYNSSIANANNKSTTLSTSQILQYSTNFRGRKQNRALPKRTCRNCTVCVKREKDIWPTFFFLNNNCFHRFLTSNTWTVSFPPVKLKFSKNYHTYIIITELFIDFCLLISFVLSI